MTPGIWSIIMHDGAGRWGCGGSDVAMGVRDGAGGLGSWYMEVKVLFCVQNLP